MSNVYDFKLRMFLENLQQNKAFDITPDRDKYTHADIERAFQKGWESGQQILRKDFCDMMELAKR